jgi:hypothetical protein
VHNVYSAPVVVNRSQATRVSFSGGTTGSHAQPTAPERQMQAAEHAGPMPEQAQHERQALTTQTQRAATNRGLPPVAATPRPSAFTEAGVQHARAAAPVRVQTATPAPRTPVAVMPPQSRPEAAPREAPDVHAQLQRAPQQQRAAPEQRAPQQQRPAREAPEGRGEPARQEEPRR